MILLVFLPSSNSRGKLITKIRKFENTKKSEEFEGWQSAERNESRKSSVEKRKDLRVETVRLVWQD